MSGFRPNVWKQIKARFFLFLLIAFSLAVNYLRMKRSTIPLTGDWDPWYHLIGQLQYFRAWQEGNSAFFTLPLVHGYWFPFYHLTGSVFSLIFGYSVKKVIFLTNAFFLVLSAIAVFQLAKLIFSRRTASWALAIFLLFPLLSAYFKEYYPDFGVMGITALSLWLLVKTESFSQSKATLALALVVPFGLFTYDIKFLLFFIPPFAFSIFFLRKKKQWIGYFLTPVPAALIYVLWILLNQGDFTARIRYYEAAHLHPGPGISNGPAAGTVYNPFLYPAGLPEYISWLLVPLIAAGLFILCRSIWKTKGQPQAYRLTLVVWGFSLFLLHPLVTLFAAWISGPPERIFLPILPAMALIAAVPLAAKNKALSWTGRGLVGAAVLAFFLSEVFFLRLPQWIRKSTPLVKQDWKFETILTDIRADSGKTFPKVIVVPSFYVFTRAAFNYYGELMRVNVPLSAFPEDLAEADYGITLAGKLIFPSGYADAAREEMTHAILTGQSEAARLTSQAFVLWKNYVLPENSTAQVYKRSRPTDERESRELNLASFRYAAGGQKKTVFWGADGDIPTPADFDGDGKADYAVFRPASGVWHILGSSGQMLQVQWGRQGDILVPGDFDGDGKADYAVFRPASGVWHVRGSSGKAFSQQWGIPTDIPFCPDLDADGRADYVVYRPATGEWFSLTSSRQTIRVTGVPAFKDSDGDGRKEKAEMTFDSGETQIVFLPALLSSAASRQGLAVRADFEGTGKIEVAVFQSGLWIFR